MWLRSLRGDDRFQRRYLTKAEQAEELEAYLADLKLESQAVETAG